MKPMRKAVYAGEAEEGRALLERAPIVHIATTDAEGRPILRAVHGVLEGDLLAFHGAPAGEKMSGLGRRAVASAHEVIAEIPSWVLDAERACPATTYYVSAQVDGVLEEVTDAALKARILQKLMAKFQPEGRHAPIDPSDASYGALYERAVKGLLVAAVRIESLACKAKLGQNRKDEDRTRVIEQLWKRGTPADLAAVDFLVRRFPNLAPASFRADGLSFFCALDPAEVDEVLSLLRDVYWLTEIPEAKRRAAILGSSVVIARDTRGIAAFARAVSDGRTAWIYDVVVRPESRRSGVGRALFRFLLDHPAVRNARLVRLGTRDAMGFYRRFGFVDLAVAQAKKPYVSTEMVLARSVEIVDAPHAAFAL
jgi:ribosomal protein S18 acetylase RimI-like enzyme